LRQPFKPFRAEPPPVDILSVNETAKRYNIRATMVTQYTTALDLFPLWGLFLAIVVLVLAAIEGGYRLGSYRHRQPGREKETPVGAMVGAMLGLLAFMLAFTFGLAGSRFEGRREIVLSEANAIGTAYLRGAMLPEPMGTDERNLLREYVDVRLQAAQQQNLDEAIAKSEQLHERLWSTAIAASQKERSPTTNLFVTSLNDVINLHAVRLQRVRGRVPSVIWLVLYMLLSLTMVMIGYQQGLTGAKRSLAVIALVLGFSTVLFLIADLDRPGQGMLQTSQQAMMDLRRSMK